MSTGEHAYAVISITNVSSPVNGQLSHRFQNIIQAMLTLYGGWLRAHALRNVEDSQVPLNERKRMLHQYHRAWEALPVDKGFCALSTNFSPHQPPPLVLESGWIVVSDFIGGLTFAKLPTMSCYHDPFRHDGWFIRKQLSYNNLPRSFTYRFDPSQDLLIFLGTSSPQRDP